MAIELFMDTPNDSMVQMYGTYGKKAVRGGVAHNLPMTGNKYDVLWAVMGAVREAVGDTYPGFNDLYLIGVQVFGISYASAAIRCQYDGFNGVASGYYVEAGSTMASYATNMLPGTKALFKTQFTPASGTVHRIPPDLLTLQLLRPIRKVSSTIIKSGNLDDLQLQQAMNLVGWVNDKTWMGKQPGSWLTIHASANVSKYQGYYTKRVEAIAQGDDLWRYFGVMRSSVTGRYAIDDNSQDLLDSMRIAPYEYGIATANGLIAVDPYKTRDFPGIFGF